MFGGHSFEDDVPDHSALIWYGNYMTYKKSFDLLLKLIYNQLEYRGVMLKEVFAIVDASSTDTTSSPKGKSICEITEDRQEDNRSQEQKDNENKSMQLVKIR